MSNLELELELLEEMKEEEARQEVYTLLTNNGIQVSKNIEENMSFLMKKGYCERIFVTLENDEGIFVYNQLK
jgi:hypothetical protein